MKGLSNAIPIDPRMHMLARRSSDGLFTAPPLFAPVKKDRNYDRRPHAEIACFQESALAASGQKSRL